jgi:hypothetical protein
MSIIQASTFWWKSSSSGGSMVTTNLLFSLDATQYSGSGTSWPDSTDHGTQNNFTLTGSPPYTSGSSGYFNFTSGSTMRAQSANNLMKNNLAAYTKAILFQPPTLIAPPGHAISSSSETGPFFAIVQGSATAGNSNSTAITYTKSPNFSNTLWYYLIVTFDSTLGSNNWKFYLNGNATPVAQATSNTKNSNPATIQINASSNSNGFQGKIAVVQMWEKALTGSEVTQMYGLYSNRYKFV